MGLYIGVPNKNSMGLERIRPGTIKPTKWSIHYALICLSFTHLCGFDDFVKRATAELQLSYIFCYGKPIHKMMGLQNSLTLTNIPSRNK